MIRSAGTHRDARHHTAASVMRSIFTLPRRPSGPGLPLVSPIVTEGIRREVPSR